MRKMTLVALCHPYLPATDAGHEILIDMLRLPVFERRATDHKLYRDMPLCRPILVANSTCRRLQGSEFEWKGKVQACRKPSVTPYPFPGLYYCRNRHLTHVEVDHSSHGPSKTLSTHTCPVILHGLKMLQCCNYPLGNLVRDGRVACGRHSRPDPDLCKWERLGSVTNGRWGREVTAGREATAALLTTQERRSRWFC